MDGYRLQTWDVKERFRAGYPQWRIRYRLTHPDGRIIFDDDDVGCATGDALDSDECLRAVLNGITLREGDYFEGYTDEQKEWRDASAEALSIWAVDPEDCPDCDGTGKLGGEDCEMCRGGGKLPTGFEDWKKESDDDGSE